MLWRCACSLAVRGEDAEAIEAELTAIISHSEETREPWQAGQLRAKAVRAVAWARAQEASPQVTDFLLGGKEGTPPPQQKVTDLAERREENQRLLKLQLAYPGWDLKRRHPRTGKRRGEGWEPQIMAALTRFLGWGVVSRPNPSHLQHLSDQGIDASGPDIAREVNTWLMIHDDGGPGLSVSTCRTWLRKLKERQVIAEAEPHRPYVKCEETRDGKREVTWSCLPKVWVMAGDWTLERITSIGRRRRREIAEVLDQLDYSRGYDRLPGWTPMAAAA